MRSQAVSKHESPMSVRTSGPTEIIVCLRAKGVEVHGQLVAVDGAVDVPRLRARHTHVVQSVRMLRVVRQRLLVKGHTPL